MPLDNIYAIFYDLANQESTSLIVYMPEVPPPPQAQQPSPEQRPNSPAQAANGFLNKWSIGNRISTVGWGITSAVNSLFSLDQFSQGHTSYGWMFLSFAAENAILAGINLYIGHRIKKRQERNAMQ